jgi:hypothetical protein
MNRQNNPSGGQAVKKVLTAQTNDEGVLLVPLGPTEANKTVRVTVELIENGNVPTTPAQDRDEWLRFIERTAGSITDPTFVRHPQGEYEERDPLS